MHTYMMYKHVCMQHVCMHRHMHTNSKQTHVFICKNSHALTCMRIQTYTHVHMHTHAHKRTWDRESHPPGRCLVCERERVCVCVSGLCVWQRQSPFLYFSCGWVGYGVKVSGMEWLRLVGCLKMWVSFAKELYKRDLYSAKRHIFLSILLIVATP